MQINETNIVVDEDFNQHMITEKLGQGGQGIVFRTNDPDIAIKFVIDDKGQFIVDKEKIIQFRQKINNIKYLPTPQDINISTPLVLLKEYAGYIMPLLTEMESFETFWSDGKSIAQISNDMVPDWLQGMPDLESSKQIVYYMNSGGLQRRLKVLSKCASVLARLHGRGLVYGDISPGNVFSSSDENNSNVWFIDPDNLRFYSSKIRNGVYTPKYGAPELVQGKKNGSYRTDCYAFSVMAFYMLSMIHPFVGDQVTNDDGVEDWADTEIDEADMEEMAFEGKLSWVDDTSDDSNKNDGGLPRTLILTEKLSILFNDTFSKGRELPWKRPSIFHWPEALMAAHDKTIVCPSCKMSWFYDIEEDGCPYCHTQKPNCIKINSFNLNGKEKKSNIEWSFVQEVVEQNQKIILPQRIFLPFSVTNNDEPFLIIEIKDEIIQIKKEETIDEYLYIAMPSVENGKFKNIISKLIFPKNNEVFYFYINSTKPMLIECTYEG